MDEEVCRARRPHGCGLGLGGLLPPRSPLGGTLPGAGLARLSGRGCGGSRALLDERTIPRHCSVKSQRGGADKSTVSLQTGKILAGLALAMVGSGIAPSPAAGEQWPPQPTARYASLEAARDSIGAI